MKWRITLSQFYLIRSTFYQKTKLYVEENCKTSSDLIFNFCVFIDAIFARANSHHHNNDLLLCLIKIWFFTTVISPCGWLGSSSSKLRTMLIRAYNLRRKSPSRHSFNTFECHLVSNIVIKSYYRRVSCC